MKIKVGDLVKVINTGATHDTYPIEKLTKDIETIKSFCYGQTPSKKKEYKVVGIFPLNDSSDEYLLHLIQEEGWLMPIYIVGTPGLIKIGEEKDEYFSSL